VSRQYLNENSKQPDAYLSAEDLLQKHFAAEVRLLNPSLPVKRKSLADLLTENIPHIICSDGSKHIFKKKELKLLAEILNQEEQQNLYLPVILLITAGIEEVTVVGKPDLLTKIIKRVLNTDPLHRAGNVIIYKSQLGEIRKLLRTTTQYVFSLESNK
jgi:uncharacterized protein